MKYCIVTAAVVLENLFVQVPLLVWVFWCCQALQKIMLIEIATVRGMGGWLEWESMGSRMQPGNVRRSKVFRTRWVGRDHHDRHWSLPVLLSVSQKAIWDTKEAPIQTTSAVRQQCQEQKCRSRFITPVGLTSRPPLRSSFRWED